MERNSIADQRRTLSLLRGLVLLALVGNFPAVAQEAPKDLREVMFGVGSGLLSKVVHYLGVPSFDMTSFPVQIAAYRQQMQVLRWHVTDQQLQKAFKLALQAVGAPQRTEITDAIDLSLYREIIRSRKLSD